MSDFDNGIPGPPNRPDVPEFWHLSEIVLGMDADAEDEAGLLKIITEIIPEEVLTYMAEQRTLFAFDRDPLLSMVRGPLRFHFFILMVAAYHDAFCAGAIYQKKYGEKVPE